MSVLCYNTKCRHGVRPGQAVLEYVLAFAGLLIVVAILWGLVSVVVRHSVRTDNIVSSEYP